VVTAFSIGYRHVDTALGYKNQQGVGAGLAKAALAQNLKRDEYFVTSKIPGGLNASATEQALDLCLKQLKLDHVDLMLLHFPIGSAGGGPELRKEEWLALEAWAKKGKARAIGVSHYCRTHLDDVLSVATLPVALNQNQYHVGMGSDTQTELHDKAYSESKGVVFMAYSSLCGPCPPPQNNELISGPLVSTIGKKHNKTGAQVALRWVVQQKIPVIPKASDPKYLAEDFALFDFSLSDDEMKQLTAATSPPETGTPKDPDDAQDCSIKQPAQSPFH
jgi:diketogulonate reductase-like aldo/keto reductase